ncbi:metallophosphoesterase [bacterium]|nr:metallophosphoesterase [bacterium]
MVQVRKINIEAGFIKDVLKGKTVVHLSDLHLSGLGEKEEEILNKIEQINPDLILLTGDYIKWSGDIAPVLKFFSRLKAKIGVFAVMGDYDYSNSRTSCLFCHEKGKARLTSKHNVIMLANSSHKIKINDQVIEITGIDRGYDEQLAFKANAKANEKNILRLVLSHSPLSFDDLDSKDKILMFAGDTHGGQVKLPLWVFKLFGYDKNVKYNYGLFYQENKTMYVTRGTGTSHFKFRLFCPPEIAVFEF